MTQDELSNWVRSSGINVVAAELGMGRETIARYLAGLPVRNGTLAQLAAAKGPRQGNAHPNTRESEAR